MTCPLSDVSAIRLPARDDWQAQFDACLQRLREIDAEIDRTHRAFIADMREAFNVG